MNSQKINDSDIPKYLNAVKAIRLDTLNKDREIRVSDWIIDMDRFYFKPQLKDDLHLSAILDSIVKFSWFEDFRSQELFSIFESNNNFSESIIFFSLVEENTLRADLFLNRMELHSYEEIIKRNNDKVYAYLFIFNDEGDIIRQFRSEIIYEPF